MSPCGASDTVVERREGRNIVVAVQRLCHTAARGLLPLLLTRHERYRYEGWYACLEKTLIIAIQLLSGEIPVFSNQILVTISNLMGFLLQGAYKTVLLRHLCAGAPRKCCLHGES